MEQLPQPYFTEEHNLFYLWRPEPRSNKTQLEGEFKSEEILQARSLELFGAQASWKAVD
ncbi:MAG TPA: hypothetical protein VEA92_02890 [Candidatus Paceibacterota bacterium]|nr:hypothetical protein [Candidatus Paceibacterota bacterium]